MMSIYQIKNKCIILYNIMNKYDINENSLMKMYCKDKLSIVDMSLKVGCSPNLIYHYIKKFGIPKRKKNAYNLKNLLGMKFSNLLVIKKDKSKNERAYWICECECGEKKSVRASHLIGKKIKSCGCSQFVNHWKGYGEISGEKWNSIKKCAASRKLLFNITIEYIWELYLKQKGKCALSGVPIIFSTWWKGEQTASLDRIDSKNGYEIGNVQWIHKAINKMKGKLSDQKFVEWCKTISQHHI